MEPKKEQSYSLISEPYSFLLDAPGTDKEFIGDRENRVCLFCGKTPEEVPFKKEAHIIPAALANRTLFNYNECDICNEHYFSPQENELANFLMLDRIFVQARKRSGSPKYKPSGKESFIEGKVGKRKVEMKIMEGEGVFEVIEQNGENIMVLKVNDPPPYRPADICKCLTHMAWSLLPDTKRKKLPYVANWLLGEIDIFPLYLDVAFVPGSGYSRVILEMWESTDPNSKYPLAIRFTFGLKILTFYLPIDPTTSEKPERNYHYIQAPDNIEIKVDSFAILDNGRLKPNDLTYTFRFRSKDEASR